MIPKIMINKIGNASANSRRAWAGFLSDLMELNKPEVKILSFCIGHPLNGLGGLRFGPKLFERFEQDRRQYVRKNNRYLIVR